MRNSPFTNLEVLDGQNPARKPVDVGIFSHHLQGFSTIPGVLGLGISEPSTVTVNTLRNKKARIYLDPTCFLYLSILIVFLRLPSNLALVGKKRTLCCHTSLWLPMYLHHSKAIHPGCSWTPFENNIETRRTPDVGRSEKCAKHEKQWEQWKYIANRVMIVFGNTILHRNTTFFAGENDIECHIGRRIRLVTKHWFDAGTT